MDRESAMMPSFARGQVPSFVVGPVPNSATDGSIDLKILEKQAMALPRSSP
jgi:hypothetical protein